LEFDAEATDIDLPPQTLTFNIDGKPDNANFDAATGVFSWTPTEMQDEIYTFEIVVSDGFLTDSETITVTVNEVNEAPTLNPISIAETQIAVGEPVTFTATASDDDYVLGEPNTLTFSIEDGVSGLVPTGASITNAGYFTWTPSSIQYPGSYTFDVVVSDNYLTAPKTASETITIDVLYNARIGENVNVKVDPDVALTFNLVNERGITTAESSIDPELFGLYPLSGIIGEYYDITVETEFFDTNEGNGVIVAIHYDDTGLNKKQETELRLFTSDGDPIEGDFNGDGTVDVKDQVMLTTVIIDPNGTPYEYIYDVNLDEELNQQDLEYFKTNLLGNTSWIDITTEIDTNNNIIYGFTDHFSGFGVRR
jgi:hypothetical protein